MPKLAVREAAQNSFGGARQDPGREMQARESQESDTRHWADASRQEPGIRLAAQGGCLTRGAKNRSGGARPMDRIGGADAPGTRSKL